MTGPDQLSQTVQTVRILWFMGLKQMRGFWCRQARGLAIMEYGASQN